MLTFLGGLAIILLVIAVIIAFVKTAADFFGKIFQSVLGFALGVASIVLIVWALMQIPVTSPEVRAGIEKIKADHAREGRVHSDSLRTK